MDHKADARQALHERGYEGVLIRGDSPLKLLVEVSHQKWHSSYHRGRLHRRSLNEKSCLLDFTTQNHTQGG
jgi:hypothetical protein